MNIIKMTFIKWLGKSYEDHNGKPSGTRLTVAVLIALFITCFIVYFITGKEIPSEYLWALVSIVGAALGKNLVDNVKTKSATIVAPDNKANKDEDI